MASSTVQDSVKAAYYRGGTSRAVIFQEDELPKDQARRKELFLQVMGSRDPHGRQLNGMGAGVSSLSKICIVKSTSGQGAKAHVDYTFVGMGIEGDETDYMGNCGNMSSAIGHMLSMRGFCNNLSQKTTRSLKMSRSTYTTPTLASSFAANSVPNKDRLVSMPTQQSTVSPASAQA
jgi:2-methylaconitate cis-trans-isomerase PrpF